jgi:hypothetical protein
VVVRVPDERRIRHHHRRNPQVPVTDLVRGVDARIARGGEATGGKAGASDRAFDVPGQDAVAPAAGDGDEVAAARVEETEEDAGSGLLLVK